MTDREMFLGFPVRKFRNVEIDAWIYDYVDHVYTESSNIFNLFQCQMTTVQEIRGASCTFNAIC